MNQAPVFNNAIALRLDPLDPLFFRDGRPFGVGTPRARSGMPTPRTLGGMIRWNLIERAGADPARIRRNGHWLSRLAVRGPWLARYADNSSAAPTDVYTPAPAHLVRRGKSPDAPLSLLAPLPPGTPLPGWSTPNPYEGHPPLVPLWGGWLRDALSPVTDYLTRAGLASVLAGQCPDPDPDRGLQKPGHLFQYEDRTAVGIDPQRQTAADGLLYSLRLLTLKDRIGFYAEVGAEDDDPQCLERLRDLLAPGTEFPAPFGGEGRRVALRVLAEPLSWPDPPQPPEAPGQGGFTSLLLSPACFSPRDSSRGDARRVPPSPLGTLVAAAIPRPHRETGWHHRGGAAPGAAGRAAGIPRPLRSLVPAGATYFWQSGRQREGAPPPRWQLAPTPVDRANGYGLALRGVWHWWSDAR